MTLETPFPVTKQVNCIDTYPKRSFKCQCVPKPEFGNKKKFYPLCEPHLDKMKIKAQILLIEWRPLRREHLVKLFVGVVGNVGEHVAEVDERVDLVQPGRSHQRRDGRRPAGTVVRASKQIIFASLRHWTNLVFNPIVINLQTTIVGVANQTLPFTEHVGNRLKNSLLKTPGETNVWEKN